MHLNLAASLRCALAVTLDKYQNVLMRLAQLAPACELASDPDRQRPDRGDKDRLVVEVQPRRAERLNGIPDEVIVVALLIPHVTDDETGEAVFL